MHNLRRFYYQNKKQIWFIIALIAFIIIIIQVLNYISTLRNQKDFADTKINNDIENSNKINNSNTYVTSNKSISTGEIINEENTKLSQQIIEKFVNACNNGEIEEAYDLLSNDCKNELYPTVNDFKRLYFDYNFNDNVNKIANIESYTGDIYKINLKIDAMSTGKISNESKQDYMTIVKENEEYKLNINSYIGTEELDKTTTQNGIKITAVSKKIYMDYEEYTINVINNTQNKICLDTLENTKTIYLQDENNIKYYSYSHELFSKLLEINSGFSTKLTIKFAKSYGANKEKELIFSDVILDSNNSEKSIIRLSL